MKTDFFEDEKEREKSKFQLLLAAAVASSSMQHTTCRYRELESFSPAPFIFRFLFPRYACELSQGKRSLNQSTKHRGTQISLFQHGAMPY